jgi:ribose transport system substrate-binding protein
MERKMNARTKLLKIILVALLVIPFGVNVAPAQEGDVPDIYLGNSIRSLSNPYHAAWNDGGMLFAESLGLEDNYQVLLSEGDSTKQLDDIRALLARAGSDVVFNVDPNETANARPIAEMLEEAGVYFVTQWNKPDDLHPWDFDYYVAHMQADDFQMGYDTAVAMFEALGGEGKVLHIQGQLGNAAAAGRFEGFRAALEEYPGIEFLEAQSADWDQTKAQTLVENWLVQYPEINGIHGAGDMHALGAAAAIKASRPELLGEILLTGCAGDEPTTRAIIAGEVFATAGIDAKWQGGMGLALPYMAYTGELDLASLPHEQREFYFGTTLVTAENAEQWLEEQVLGTPEYDWSDPWSNVIGQIQYADEDMEEAEETEESGS